MACTGSSGVKGPSDFTGYWALAADKFGGSAIDLISHSGSAMRVTSLNAKGSWARVYDVDREVVQPNAEGTPCKTTSWWEGRVFRCRMEGSSLGVLESWRYLRGNSMAVRTSLRLPPRPPTPGSPPLSGGGGHEVVMFWFFDRMEALQRHVARGRVGGSLLQQIETDQRHVQKATRKDTQYIRDVLLDWQRWRSPADDFIQLASPPLLSRATHRRRRSPRQHEPRLHEQVAFQRQPDSAARRGGAALRGSLYAQRQPQPTGRKRAQRGSPGPRGATSSRPGAGAAQRGRRCSATTAAGGGSRGSARGSGCGGPAAAGEHEQEAGLPGAATPGLPPEPPAAPRPAAAAASAAADRDGEPGETAGEGEEERIYAREATLAYRGDGGRHPCRAAALRPGSCGARRLHHLPPSCSTSTAGWRRRAGQHTRPVPGSRGLGPRQRRRHARVAARQRRRQRLWRTDRATAPARWLGGQRSRAATLLRALQEPVGRLDGTRWQHPGRASPRSTPATQHPLSPVEQVMAFRLHEFGDARGIASVVPVNNPNDTSEPQLLSMSPEQAEETAAKLRELEMELMLRRQENRRGWPAAAS
ncbi:hypothetical protein ABPG77_007205 [Micractinium sp. CCAP 211/92]